MQFGDAAHGLPAAFHLRGRGGADVQEGSGRARRAQEGHIFGHRVAFAGGNQSLISRQGLGGVGGRGGALYVK